MALVPHTLHSPPQPLSPMPKDTDTGKAFRKLLARDIFLRRKEPELATAATNIPYVDEKKVVRAGKLSRM